MEACSGAAGGGAGGAGGAWAMMSCDKSKSGTHTPLCDTSGGVAIKADSAACCAASRNCWASRSRCNARSWRRCARVVRTRDTSLVAACRSKVGAGSPCTKGIAPQSLMRSSAVSGCGAHWLISSSCAVFFSANIEMGSSPKSDVTASRVAACAGAGGLLRERQTKNTIANVNADATPHPAADNTVVVDHVSAWAGASCWACSWSIVRCVASACC